MSRFGAAALPRAVGIGEVDLDPGVLGELGMARHFRAAIIGQRFTEGLGQVLSIGLHRVARRWMVE